MPEPSHFNFEAFQRSGGRWPTPDALTNGYTLQQLHEIRDILSTMTDDQIVSRYLSDPLPNYHIERGGNHMLDRASRFASILPVTHSDINPSGLRELKISPTLGMRDDGEEKLVIRFARPYTFNLFAGDFQLFSDIEGRKVSCSVEEFDQTFTNASRDKNILFDSSKPSLFQGYEYNDQIKGWPVDSESDTDRLLVSLLLQPIGDYILKQNIEAKTRVSSITVFISRMMGLGRLGEEPLTDNQLWRKLWNYKRALRLTNGEFEMVKNIINKTGNDNYKASIVLDKLCLNKLSAVITEKDEVGNYKLEGIVKYMVRSQQNLNMRGFNLRVDFACAFIISPEDAEKLFLFNGISPSLRNKTLAIVPTILIESKHVFTRVPSLLLKILNDPTIKKHNMVGAILKKVVENISIEKTDLNGDCSSLDADLNEINEFMEKNRTSLKNIGYSINKLIMEGLFLGVSHMILTDYEVYLFIKIAPSTNEHGNPLDIQMFVLDSQSPEAKENFKFRVLSFCLDAHETSNVSQVLEELERGDKFLREVMNRSCYGFKKCDPTPSFPADVRSGGADVSEEGHQIGDADEDMVDIPSLEASSSKSPEAEEGITLGIGDLKVSPPSTSSTQDWLDDDFVAKSYLVDSSARSRPFITSGSSAIIGHNNWFDIDYTHWFRFMTTNLPSCIPYQSCFLVKESSTSIVVAFKDTEANPEFLRELGTKAEGHWLVIKLLKQEPGCEDEDSDDNANQSMDQNLEPPLSPELVERLENEVRTLIGLNNERKGATDNPQMISAGYINDVAPPRCSSVLSFGENSSRYGAYLSSISGPFLLFKSNVVESGQMADSKIIDVTELTPEIVSMLEESQKMEIVELFKKLHHKNILHNAVELGNILVYYSRSDCSEHNHEWLNFETFLPIRFKAPLSNSEEGDDFEAPVCFDPKNINFFQLIDFENSQSITGQNEEERFQREIQEVEMMLE